MPGVKVFIDTNVLVYLHDRNTPSKSVPVERWLEFLAARSAGRTNLQVLNEVTSLLLRKRWFAEPRQVFAVVEEFRVFGDDPIGQADVTTARRLHERFRFSWWDCLLLASALELGCTHFLSEDLQDGQRVESLTIVDPFAHSPGDILRTE